MPALNFKAQFADDVAAGRKRQTIRLRRRDGRDPKVGDRLYLYTGMRTKTCRKLGEAECRDTCAIRIEHDKIWTFGPQELHVGDELERMAQYDGFSDWAEMRDWFEKTHGLPFVGRLIRWRLVEQAKDR